MATILRSEKLMRKKRIKRTFVTAGIIVFLCICVGIPAWLSRIEFFTITSIEVVGAEITPQNEITSLVEQSIAGNYWYVYRKKSAIFYPKREIQRIIFDHYPRIESINISLQGFSHLVVKIVEREPFALWCDGTKSCYAMDKYGFIFGEAPDFSSASIYPQYGGVLSDKPIGTYFVPEDQFLILESYRNGLVSLGISPQTIFADNEGNVEARYENGSKIFFSMNDNVDQTIVNLSSVLNDPSSTLIVEGSLGVLSLDMRFGNKIVVKKKTE